MNKIKGINTRGWEKINIPVSMYTLTRTAEIVREMLLSDGIDIDDECKYILNAISGATRGVIDSDAIIEDVEQQLDIELNTYQP